MIEFQLQGVRAKQVRAVNEIPTPYGVADLPTKQVGSLTGVSLTAFLFSTPCRTPHESKHPSRGGAEGKRTRYATVLLMMVKLSSPRSGFRGIDSPCPLKKSDMSHHHQ